MAVLIVDVAVVIVDVELPSILPTWMKPKEKISKGTTKMYENEGRNNKKKKINNKNRKEHKIGKE